LGNYRQILLAVKEGRAGTKDFLDFQSSLGIDSLGALEQFHDRFGQGSQAFA
jgi:hypothetical protein